MKPSRHDNYTSKSSGKAVKIADCFEIRPGEWWVSFKYMPSCAYRSLTLDQFQARFELAVPWCTVQGEGVNAHKRGEKP